MLHGQSSADSSARAQTRSQYPCSCLLAAALQLLTQQHYPNAPCQHPPGAPVSSGAVAALALCTGAAITGSAAVGGAASERNAPEAANSPCNSASRGKKNTRSRCGQKRSKAVKRPAPLASYRQRGRPGVPPRLLTVSICIQACACASPEPRACVRGSTGTAQRRGRPALASARRPLRTPFPAPRSASDYLALLLISFSRVSRVARGPRQSTAAPDTPCRPAACSS